MTPEDIHNRRAAGIRMRAVLREMLRLQRRTGASTDELEEALLEIKRMTPSSPSTD